MNKVYLSDVFDFLEKLEDNSIDLAIVDPPYNLSKGEWDSFNNDADYFDFTFKWIDCLIPKLKPNASIYLFNTAFNSAVILNHLREKDLVFRNWITWYKKDGFSATKRKYVNSQETILFYTKTAQYIFNSDDIRQPYLSTDRMAHAAKKGILKNGKRWYPNPNGKLCGDVWEITSQRHKEKANGKVRALSHPTVKPHEMIERMIKASSREGDTVLDLFSGSGTTSIVAQRLNRNFIGCEKSEKYIGNIEKEGIQVGRL
ncbi:MAG: site-specific DNA-methyltransferase [Ruminococcaceae bacterium]|nr:site-specific DNA-methyltransferase [Oscillospiraceae bacterium]